MLPKLVLTDVDGVLTDGGMYYHNDGNESKKFNASDGAGVLYLHLLNIPVGIITGEDTEIVRRRAEKLKIEHLYMGVKNKLEIIKLLASSLGITLDEIAYIGDDLNDVQALQACGYSAVPSDCRDYIAKHAGFKLTKKGGEGVFREFVETILMENGVFEKALQLYHESIMPRSTK